MSSQDRYVVAGNRPWSGEAFEMLHGELPGRWSFVSTPEELAGAVEGTAPRFAFFLHWAWKVPSLLLAQLECVGFHMTDLPYGRGGSPLQNLILRGHRNTVLTAFRLTHELDAGPVYLKAPLSLDGRAEEIYRRATALAASMIARIVREEPRPTPQEGVVTTFRRRRPEESELPQDLAPADAYDFIRMLDADGYPHAFVRAGAWTIELTHPVRDGETIKARAVLRKGATPQ